MKLLRDRLEEDEIFCIEAGGH
jgi:hypothetical protein